jgi:hypothetical protein
MVIHTRLLESLGIPDSVFEHALRYFHKAYRPVFLGELSAEIGWSAERTEEVVLALISNGSVRHATDEEKMAIDAARDANLYSLAVERDVAQGFKR